MKSYLASSSNSHLRKNTDDQASSAKPADSKPADSGSDDTLDPKAATIIDKSKILTEQEKLAVGIEGWLKITSTEFRNEKKFPSITLRDYSLKKINIDPSNYRINEIYDENNKTPDSPPDNQYFWFRMSDKNIYYSNTKNSYNLIGSIAVKKIVGVEPERKPSSTCFEIADQDQSKWKLCAENKSKRQAWVCFVEKMLGIDDDDCKTGVSDDSVIVEDVKVTDPVLLIPLPAKVCNDGWTYKEHGKDWDCDCKEGKTQSPIDIRSNSIYRSSVKPVFKYTDVEIPKDATESPVKIEYKDGAIRIKVDTFGNVITLDGNVFNAKEIIFHTPSQHKLDGRNSDLEVEIIHIGESKDVIAQHLVLNLLFDAKPGVYNRFFDDIDFFNLPGPMFKTRDIKNNLNLAKFLYNIDSDDYPLWKQFSFYTYEGSLTAPPCTERVIHYVKSQPLPLGNTTLQLLREAIKVPDLIDNQGNITINTSDPVNYREPQPLNGRRVYYYDYVVQNMLAPPKHEKHIMKGHYEKVHQKMTQYFAVSTEKPSGMPGAFVVSEKEALTIP